MGISIDSERYKSFRPFAVFILVVWLIGLPLLMLTVLVKVQRAYNLSVQRGLGESLLPTDKEEEDDGKSSLLSEMVSSDDKTLHPFVSASQLGARTIFFHSTFKAKWKWID